MHKSLIINKLQKTRRQWLSVAAGPFLVLLAGCNLQKDINVVLPAYPPQLVVECYLEPNQIPRMSVSESVPYLGDPQVIVPTDVRVVVTSSNGLRDTLLYAPAVNKQTGKAYTHTGRRRLVARPGDVFTLDVADTKGRHVTGTAIMPAIVPIDTVEWKFNDKPAEQRKALVLNKFRDPAGTLDFYRFQVHVDQVNRDPDVDYKIEDRLNDGQKITLGTGYEFDPQDTLVVSLYHLDQPYYRYLQSVQDARNANGNPFAQPASIKSTVQGGIGIFTVLSYQRRTIVIK